MQLYQVEIQTHGNAESKIYLQTSIVSEIGGDIGTQLRWLLSGFSAGNILTVS